MNELSDDDIDRIVNAYEQRSEIEKFSHIASIDEIRENGFNCNIPRYVNTFEEEEPIDIEKVTEDIEEIHKAYKETESTLKGFFDELGIRFPNLD